MLFWTAFKSGPHPHGNQCKHQECKLGHHPVLILPVLFQAPPLLPPVPPNLDLTQMQNVISLLLLRVSPTMVAPLLMSLKVIPNGGVWPGRPGATVRLHALNMVWQFPIFSLGEPVHTKSDVFLDKFQMGAGGHFQSKQISCNFWLIFSSLARQIWTL